MAARFLKKQEGSRNSTRRRYAERFFKDCPSGGMGRKRNPLDVARVEILAHELLEQEPITVVGECGRMPDGIVWKEADKTGEQHVVIEQGDQYPLRSSAVNRLQQRDQQQLLLT